MKKFFVIIICSIFSTTLGFAQVRNDAAIDVNAYSNGEVSVAVSYKPSLSTEIGLGFGIDADFKSDERTMYCNDLFYSEKKDGGKIHFSTVLFFQYT